MSDLEATLAELVQDAFERTTGAIGRHRLRYRSS